MFSGNRSRFTELYGGLHGNRAEDIYCDRLLWNGVLKAVQEGKASVSIRDGAYAQIPKVYADVYRDDLSVQAFDFSSDRYSEALF